MIEIKLKEVESKDVRQLIEENHYSHKCTPNHFLSFDINNGQGAIQLGFGIRPAKKNSISSLITKDNYCEFDRMWLSDDLPKNSESHVIGLLIRYIKKNYPKIKFIITYADGSANNRGIIYKASNATEIDPIMCDFYRLADGERVHPVSMWHRHKTRAWATMQELYPGIKHIKGTKKNPVYQYRFIYILNKGLRKKFQEEKRQASSLKGLVQFRPSAQKKCDECGGIIKGKYCEDCLKEFNN